MARSKQAAQLEAAQQALRACALGYPEVVEEFPWGESAFKIKRKVFLFMRGDATSLGLSTKLPHSAAVALSLPFAQPTGYGLGKAGWVSATFSAGQAPPLELLREWIDESFRAIAPAKVVAGLGTGGAGRAPKQAPAQAAGKAKPKPARAAKPAAKRAKPKPAKAIKRR